MTKSIRWTFIMVFLTACMVSGISQAGDNKVYTLGTGSKGGTYYPVGQAIEVLSKVKLLPIKHMELSAVTSAGSGENIRLLRENKAQFGILQGLYGYYAWNGKGPLSTDGPQKELRSVTMLWKNVEHFIISAESTETGSISDMQLLKNKKMALGKKNSGTIGSNNIILSNFGIDLNKDFQLVYGGYSKSINAFKEGEVAGLGTPSGIPAKAVHYGYFTMGDKLKLLSFTEEQAKQADGGLGLWTPYTIPAGTYPGQKADIQTIAQPNFLAVREDVDEESVYQITKLLYENLGFLQNIHSAVKEMGIEKALDGLPIPLHPGAARYYREVGLNIPERLVM